LIVDLFIIIILAAKTFFANVFKTAFAAFSFIQQLAFPFKIDASLGVTFFYPQHMIHRNAVVELVVSRRFAFKDVGSFVKIDHFTPTK